MLGRSFSASVLALLVATVGLAVASSAEAQTRYPVNITTTPPGVTVYLDSAATPPLGVTPLRSVRVARGQHNFIFRLEGYQEVTQPVNVARYNQQVTQTMVQLARLQISAVDESAQGAIVTVDGERRGTVPFSEYLVPARVQIVVSRDGYVPRDQWVTLSPGQIFAWPVELQRNAPRTGSLAIFADLRNAPVFIDGTQRCTTPCTLSDVVEGPHLIEIRPSDAGANPFTQQVVVVAGQMATVDAHIQVAPQTGSLRVLSTAPGAMITVDGEPVGAAPATRDGLQPGDHIVEVTAAGYNRSQQTVSITAGQQRVISVELSAVAASSGSVRVIGGPRGAVVTVDGEPIGELPALREGVPAGDHIVEVSMAGYVTSTQTVTITAGQQRVVSVQLAEAPREPGRIIVRANVPGATVFVDGESRGPAPFVQDRAPVGTHAVIVRANGFQEYSQTCNVGPGVDCVVEATLTGARIRIRAQVQSGIPGAVLVVDGSELGPVPYEGELGVGPHRVEIRAPGYRVYTEQVQLSDNDPPRVFDVRLTSQNELTPEEVAAQEQERERAMRRAFTRTGAPLPRDLATADISVGWPTVFEARLNMGVHRNIDTGIMLRNTGVLTEFWGRVRVGHIVNRQFSVGGQFSIGGGFGPTRTRTDATAGDIDHKTNTFGMSVDAMASLHFSRVGAFTLIGGIDYFSDRYDWTLSDNNVLQDANPATASWDDPGRQGTVHGRLGGILEIALSNANSLFFSGQGVFGASRRVQGDMYGVDGIHVERSSMGMHADFRFGWSHKFNWRIED